MQQQQKKPSWIQQLFCGCVREEPAHLDQRMRRLSTQMEITKAKPQNLISVQQQSQQDGWLNKGTSQEINYMENIESENESDEDQKIYTRQLSYLEKNQQLQKTSFSDEFNSNNMEMKLLHRYGGLLARQNNIQAETQSNQWIMKIFKDVQLFIQEKEFEQKFKAQLLHPFIGSVLNQRIKQNQILLAHDPTGCIMLKLASPTRKIYYLEQDLTFSNVIERGVCKLKVQVEKVLKMDLTQQLDIVIVNLYFIECQNNLKNIMYEYLQYAHDIIIILQPNIDNQTIYQSAEQALLLSEQSKHNCSVELQIIKENNNCLAKILYFGDITEITLNDELNFVYSCVDSTIKKQFNYKLMFRDLRHQLGMSKLIKLMNDYQIIQGTGSFIEFLGHLQNCKEKYRIVQQNSTRDFEQEQKQLEKKNTLSDKQSSSSSTESEPEDEENAERLDFRSESLGKSQNSIQPPPLLRHANSQPFYQ